MSAWNKYSPSTGTERMPTIYFCVAMYTSWSVTILYEVYFIKLKVKTWRACQMILALAGRCNALIEGTCTLSFYKDKLIV